MTLIDQAVLIGLLKIATQWELETVLCQLSDEQLKLLAKVVLEEGSSR